MDLLNKTLWFHSVCNLKGKSENVILSIWDALFFHGVYILINNHRIPIENNNNQQKERKSAFHSHKVSFKNGGKSKRILLLFDNPFYTCLRQSNFKKEAIWVKAMKKMCRRKHLRFHFHKIDIWHVRKIMNEGEVFLLPISINIVNRLLL